MVVEIVIFIIGVTVLWLGAEWFIKGGRIISGGIGISPLLIGLTLGAVGTSLPEFIVSSIAAVFGKTGISIGNVVGSNMANIGLALGLGSLLFPIPVEKQVIRYDYWVLLCTGIIFYIFSRNMVISGLEGIFFMVIFSAYMVSLATRHYFSKYENKTELKKGSILKGVVFFIIGTAGLAIGANYVVRGAIKIAVLWGMSETVVGITLVAVGTSLPEIAVVLAGSLRKQPEISIGTIVGSNIINILLITGTASIISPIVLNPAEIIFQAPAVILFTLLLFPVIITDRKISRLEGLLLFITYLIYIFYVI